MDNEILVTILGLHRIFVAESKTLNFKSIVLPKQPALCG